MDSQTHTDSAAGTKNMTETDAVFRTLALDPNEEYKMSRKRRGLAIIFNQEYFYWQMGMSTRHGTNADRSNLERRLKALNFEVKVYDNSKQMEIWDILREAAQANHSDADCFMLIFLSHGEQDHIYAFDGKINIHDITAMFQGTSVRVLWENPKSSYCRRVVERSMTIHAVFTLPAGADFIMCYSVAEGFYSHRETINGSWYIQDLCELLHKYGDSLEFTELLTLVNRKVSMRSVGNCSDRSAIGKKQVPCFASMLTKKLYFRPKPADK
ncbi:hypothetical protein WMY93_006905 [Mugilogobius chulae]|uniref:Caspase-6 n=1 Tax=Mugilogobius chulae TaxID=88201 RepID=A0AAW0PL48_9GOBI